MGAHGAWIRRAVPALVLAGTVGTAAGGASSVLSGQAPAPPLVVTPAPMSVTGTMPPALTVQVEDPDGDSLDVTFYGRPLTSAARPDFTLVELPDTQNYVGGLGGGSPSEFLTQTSWIAAQRVPRNIACVLHVGDIVQSSDSVPSEWGVADLCMQPLEDPAVTLRPEGIPYGISPGNHDIGMGGAVHYYNQHFGVSRFAGRSYYGGHYGNDNASWFNLFTVSGIDFIVIGVKLEWAPDMAVVHWADSLLTAHASRRAILLSHYLLDPGPPATFSPQGQAIYDGLKHHTNLILMICGHFVDEARRADTWNGHTIHTIMANYQNRRGGDGWLRIMEFSPARNHIRMRTFSPTLGHFEVDADSSSQFTIPCDLSGPPGGFEPIATVPRVAPGGTVSIAWSGLGRGQGYEWFATASDGASTSTGATTRFFTVDNVATGLSTPNGGEVLTMGQQADIQWTTSDATIVGGAKIQLSRSGPAGPWVPLASLGPGATSYGWWVTGPPTDEACLRVVVRDTLGFETADTSDGPFRIATTAGVGGGTTDGLEMGPVVPNPARGSSRVVVRLAEPATIRLSILDVEGRVVAVLAEGWAAAGPREFGWDGRATTGRAPAGLYFARLEAGGRARVRRFVVMR